MRNILLIAVPAVILAFIFGNSMLNYDVSFNLSVTVLNLILRFFPYLENADWLILHALIRKLAHFTEFALLGAAVMFFYLRTRKKNIKNYLWLPALICLLAASADETIQIFAVWRNPSFLDIGIDFFGSVVGMSVVYLIHRKKNKSRGA